MKELAEKIKELRKAKKLSQEELAEKIGITQASYFQIEKGKTELSVERLFQIANVLEVSVFDLLDVVNQSSQQSGDSKRVEELELLVSHWKELAETRNERLKIKEEHLEGYKEILLDELNEIIFLWIQHNGGRYGLDSLDKWLLPLEESILKIQPEQRKQIYIESIIYRNKVLDYAIREGLLGEVGKAFKAAQNEFMNQLFQGYNKLEEKPSAKLKE